MGISGKIKMVLVVLGIIEYGEAQNTAKDFVEAHNAARSEVGVPYVVWDDTVAAYADKYAKERKANCKLVHSGGPYGENLAWGSGDMSGTTAVELWVDEKPNYDNTTNSCVENTQCLHYTQVVWGNTRRIGCAKVTCLNNTATFIICNYDPPGNVVGQRYSSFAAAPTPTPPGISPPANSTASQAKAKALSRTVIIIVFVLIQVSVSCIACYRLRRKRSKNSKFILKENFGSECTTLESLQFSLPTIEAATNNFSHANRIGKGGFGEVFKGILSDGREIAVKRLSKTSGQGAAEFKNEILLVAKLQHRNLVTLLGFCLDKEEKILVYEYVPNKSLDYFLFGSQRNIDLNWLDRYKIINGSARGIHYLHELSRLKVIHRDLKPSNILLDDEMNPKISDFGLAKMVAINETKGSTNRIVGTFGYMSPEYAMLGQYSEKSDIFSFGVIVLEIVSGKKNVSSHDSQYADGLLSYAWKQWRDDNLSDILDSNLKEHGSYNEVIKCIHIGLLCVQENPDARPSMGTIVSYLSNDFIQLPYPQEPAFFMHGRMELTIARRDSSSNRYTSNSKSINEMSMSTFFPR